MAHGNVTTNIPAELKSAATDGVVAAAEGIFDYTKNKNQEVINRELLASVAERVKNLAGSASDEQTVVKAGNDDSNPAYVTVKKKAVEIHGRAGNVTVDDDGINITAGNSGFPNATVKINGQSVATQQYVSQTTAALYGNMRVEDDEDLTMLVADNGRKELKLADKVYAPEVFSGLGRKYLRKNYSVQNAIPFNGFVEDVTVETVGTTSTPMAIFFDSVNKWFVGQVGLKYYNAWQGNGDYESVSETKTYVYNGKGYRWNGDALVEGENVKNVLTQTMITQPNTIYHIQYDYDLNGEIITLPANITLQFDGGSIANGTITGSHTIIKGDTLCFKKNVVINGTWNNEVIYTKWFDFVSSQDGVTDNSLCFKQLQGMINGSNGCKVEFTKGYYQTQIIQMHSDEKHTIDGVEYDVWWSGSTYNEDRIVLCIKDISYVDINLNGSTIQLINVTCPFVQMFAINNVENSYVHDGVFIGMAIDNFDYPTYADKSWTSPNWNYFTSSNYERCFCIYQRGGFCTIYNVNTKYSTGDGICVGSGSTSALEAKGYLVRDSEVSYCGRNGITLHSSEEGKLANCHIHHIGSDAGSGEIGTDGIKGQDPRSGIDVEFEDGRELKPIVEWDGLYIHDCGAKSFGFASPQRSIMKQFSANNCRFIGLGLPNNITAEGEKSFNNCYFEHIGKDGTLYGSATYNNCTIVAKVLGLSVGPNTFENCTITDEYDGDDDTTFFFRETISKRIFRNCTLTIKHRYGYVASNKFYNCTLNFYFNGLLCSEGAEFYDCTFNNDPDDATDYSFQFKIGNFTGGLKLVRCSFDKARGYGGGVNDYFFSYSTTYPIVVDGCSFNTLSMYHGSPCGKISFKNCSIGYFYLTGYQQTNTGVEIMTMDNCTIEDFNVTGQNALEMKMANCKVSIVSGGNFKINNVLFQNCYINNNVTRKSYYADTGVRGISSTFDFVASTPTTAFNLENCYIKGLVTETTFAGTKNACSFETPLPTSGTTAQRPSASVAGVGFKYFDTTLDKPIWSDGTQWVDATGTAV